MSVLSYRLLINCIFLSFVFGNYCNVTFTFDVFFISSSFPCDVLFEWILRRMHIPQEKAQILWRFIENNKSIVQAQRNCRRIYQKDLRSKSSILRWKKNFLETGSIADKKRSGRPCTSDFDVEHVRETLLHNPRKSVRSVASEMNMPISTMPKVIKKK